MMRWLALLILLTAWTPAQAATEAIEVYFLPMNEAAEAAKSQLSADGKIAIIASRQLLVIDDDADHIAKVRKLLKNLDKAAPQFIAHVEIEDISSNRAQQAMASGGASFGRLPGGWARLAIGAGKTISSDMRQFQLRVTGNEQASIETGVIQPVDQQVMLWLAGYGLVPANSVEMIPITSGFRVQAWPSGSDSVRVRITPWMQRQQPQVTGRQEMLIDLGTANNPAIPPNTNPNMRLNAVPAVANQPIIEIRGATTEVTIPVDQEVTIAAMDAEAKRLGSAILDSESSFGERSFAIRLRMSRE